MKSMRTTLGCLSFILPALGLAQLPPGISGTWYNPQQSGHGLSVEILDEDRALAFWYVYDPHGNPVHLYLDGRVEGDRIEATAYAPRGMRFGSFHNPDLEMPVWGEVALHFNSCDRGVLQWDSDLSEYGSGSSEIQRLTRISGLDCEWSASNEAPAALFTGIEQSSTFGPHPHAYAAVDETGELWALTPLPGQPDAVPGRSFVGLPGSITRARVTEDGSLSFKRYYSDWVFGRANAQIPTRVHGQFDVSGGSLGFAFDSGRGHSLSLSAAPAQLHRPLTTANLVGRWPVPMRGQFVDAVGELDVGEGGALCLRVGLVVLDTDCRMTGTLRPASGNSAFVEFELKDQEFPALSTYSGRGWLQTAPDGQRLVLVGDNGPIGFGLIGRR